MCYYVLLLPTASFGASVDLAFHPIHLSMGVSLSLSNSPMPSAPKASLTPSNKPIFNDVDVLDAAGAVTKACAHDVVAAATRSEDFIFFCFGICLSEDAPNNGNGVRGTQRRKQAIWKE